MSGLNVRQDKFAREYAKTGNGTVAAKRAGYTDKPDSAAVQGTRLLSNVKVSAEIQAHRRRLQERLDISRETLINNAAHIAEQASVKGEYAPAIKATELILKAQGYLVERQLNLSVDVTQSHLDALQSYTDRRIKEEVGKALKGHGEDVSAFSMRVSDVVDEHAQHNVSDRSMDVMEHPTHDDATDTDAAANQLTDKDNLPQEAEDSEAPRRR